MVLEQAFGPAVNTTASHGRVPGFESWLRPRLQLPAHADPERRQAMAAVVGSLLPAWEVWIEFLSGFFCSG